MAKRTMALGLLMALAACNTKSADFFKTSEINAQMNATATGNGSTKVLVTLHDSRNPLTYIQLTADDRLEATMGGETRELKESSLLGAVSYSTTFNKDSDGTEFRVGLIRASDGGAPDSHVALPAAFTIEPLAQGSYGRNEPLTVTWTSGASSDSMKLEVTASCLAAYEQEVGASATSAVIPPGTLQKAPAQDGATVPDECDATLHLTRARKGTVDPAFHGGNFWGKQSRSTTFRTKP